MADTHDISSTTLARLRRQAQKVGCSPDELLNQLLADEDIPDRTSPDLYRHLLDNTSDTIVIFDLELRYVYVNLVMEHLTGISRAEMLGKTDVELGMPPDQVAEWGAAWQIVIDTHEEQIIEFAFETPNGLGYFESRLTPILGKDGTLQHLLSITRNVTQRIEAERKLMASERFVNSVLRTIPNFIYIYDFIDNCNIYANEGLTEFCIGVCRAKYATIRRFSMV